MKATELRIGNQIMFTIKFDKQPEDIISITANDFTLCMKYPDNYKPIPLTEEWLLKFGFEKQGHVKFIGEAYDRFVLGKNGIYSVNEIAYIYEVNDHDLCELKYVHQLQNLYFSLTGEELTIKL